MELNIVSKVEVAVTQDDIKELIREKLRKQNPDVYVTKIDFSMGRSPAGLKVEVQAQLGKPTEEVTTSVEETSANTDTDDSINTGSEDSINTDTDDSANTGSEDSDNPQPRTAAEIFQ